MGYAAITEESPVCTLASLEARQEYRKLEHWMTSKEALAMPIHDVEAEQMKRSREVNRQLLQMHIRARGDGDVGPRLSLVSDCAPASPDGPVVQTQPAVAIEDEELSRESGTPAEVVYLRGRLHKRTMQTVFGDVEVDRRAYKLAGHDSFHPLDAQLVLPERSFSYEVQRMLTKGAIQGPFDEATANVREVTGLPLPKKSAEDIVVEAAEDFDVFYQQRPVDEGSGPILVGTVDCKGIPMKKAEPAARRRRKKGEKSNKKRMATVAAVYTQEPRVRTPDEVVKSLFHPALRVVASGDKKEEAQRKKRLRPQNKRVWASLLQGKDKVIQEVREEMDRRDPGRVKQHVALTDGERALQRKVLKLLPGILLILDLMHALGYLWKVAHVFHKEGSQEAQDYVESRTLMILQGKVSHVVRGMRQSATKRGIKGKPREAIDKATNYLYRNRHYMRYDEYLSQGLPIASGAVEGACKNLVKDRMERSGMRWCDPSAEAMLKLRATYLSRDFEAYWRFHVAQDQLRRVSSQGQQRKARVVAK